MVYDRCHHQAYVLTTKRVRVWADGHYEWWGKLSVQVISGRSRVAIFSVNEGYNTDPTDLADDNYAIEGVAFQQPMSEGSNPGRLIVDNPWTGNLDVVDLDAAGSDAARLQRYSYRDPLTSSWRSDNPANSLALEPKHETLGSDDLISTDILYIADKHHPMGSYLHALWLTHPLQDLSVTRREDISLEDQFMFFGGHYGGLAVAEGRDVLYIGCTAMSFEKGFVGKVDTNLNQLSEVLPVLGGVKEGIVLVDWYDSERGFVRRRRWLERPEAAPLCSSHLRRHGGCEPPSIRRVSAVRSGRHGLRSLPASALHHRARRDHGRAGQLWCRATRRPRAHAHSVMHAEPDAYASASGG